MLILSTHAILRRFVGWEMRRREGKARHYQGLETGGKPSAAVTQMEQTEGNSVLRKHTSHHVTTGKMVAILSLNTFPVDVPLDSFLIQDKKRHLYHLFPLLPSYLKCTGTHIQFVKTFNNM